MEIKILYISCIARYLIYRYVPHMPIHMYPPKSIRCIKHATGSSKIAKSLFNNDEYL